MKAVLLAALAMAAAPAWAQSTATLYGRMDLTVQYLNRSGGGLPGASSVNMASDTNYWGLQGTEQIGEQRAYYRIEAGFQPNTGRGGGALFDRESYVGWAGPAGNVQIGGQFAPAVTLTGRLDPFQRSMNGLIQNLMQVNAGNANRGTLSHKDNAVQYISPKLGGFTARAMYSFANNWSGSLDVTRSRALGLEYAAGRLYAALSWEGSQLARPNAEGGLRARSQDTVFLGAVYDFGDFKLHGMLLHNKLEGEATAFGHMLGLTTGLQSGTVRLSWTSRNLRHEAGSRASVYALGYTYPLSKRTTAYTSLAYLHNGDRARYNLWPDSRSRSVTEPGQSTTGFQIGLRHMF
ncbi:porin [Bordetella genomosp. 13]|uniref:Porin domain-containing protein n=1 Tax=Bordetella genomosp. 13 TaxID=463040 RepID=A0A1W6ZFA7_9BORD|nr:porin [Bordetella genomosp. 13]ARP95820.1 hypothetical protein CAL15_16405 [Bordetella genomosp. 13]